MRFNPTAKKAISAILLLLLMAGFYGAIIALCNQYLREHDMQTNSSKFILGVFMFAGFYFIYKRFSKRIDAIQKNKRLMDYEDNEYGENAVEDMMADYDYHINTGDLPELFDESSVDDFIANLNDWD